jgi:hypothetical protein
MAPGPPPKSPATRQRANRATTAKMLGEAPAAAIPDLPDDREWHSQTLAWWQDALASPMAGEYLQSDLHGLVRLAVLVDDYWQAETPTARTRLAAEIRLQGQAFGLSPIDRRRLQWEVKRAEEAGTEKPKRRRTKDPRLKLAR